ncbi:lipid IV(A) 3-deoxy-D-manno-octulosonic acid transferase [Jiella sp. KSK16Y-1]|uniref:3-deoxy-D-manno-octulosonic acid transferase n=2 Tax=Jiella mangrovi TaxID=2821407 RepID=A0ABS4BBS3_9HYPH|nr:lipid IV(A) 3-deoxy-D-manno-octulosonic acid transferase [Jiella mangrovi]MBP0614199.1 lipid IV(A) 3-deoxy-D-manno-octulosonic acid transferase [Jiella mangrovi]
MTRAAFAAYRLAGLVAYPLLRPYVGWRASRGKEDKLRRKERYGVAGQARPQVGPLVWVHAASVGETVAVAPLIRAIAADGLSVVMTTGTTTSAQLVEERLADCVIHQYVPLDVRPAVRRFLNHWQPDLAMVAESEIWPLTIHELAIRRIPQILVNARLSDRSFQRWKAKPRLAEALFENFAQVVAQSDVDAERFRLLGAPAVTMAGNLKADAGPLPAEAAFLDQFDAALGSRPRFAAISTHPGEEEIVAQVHGMLKSRHEGLLTIIVPRHVDRASAIVKMLADKGLTVRRRSLGEMPDAQTDIFLADTMGELGVYLRLTEIAFIGKSITGQGGQNPMEAAMLATGILSGRYVQNFRDTYQRLLKNGGARLVRDADTLAAQVDGLLVDPMQRMAMAGAALRSIDEMRGALGRTLIALDPFLHPLRLSVRLERRGRVAGDP